MLTSSLPWRPRRRWESTAAGRKTKYANAYLARFEGKGSAPTRPGGVSPQPELNREESLYLLLAALDALSRKSFGRDRIASLRDGLQTMLIRVRQRERPRGGSWRREQEDELVPPCDPTRTVLAPQFLSELTKAAHLLGQVLGGDLVFLARDIVETERFAAAA